MQQKTVEQIFQSLQQCGKTFIENLNYIKEQTREPDTVESAGVAIAKIEAAFAYVDQALSWFTSEQNEKPRQKNGEQQQSMQEKYREGRLRQELRSEQYA